MPGPESRHSGPTPSPRGRGAAINPTNRFESLSLEVLGEHVDEILAESPDGTMVRTFVYTDRSRSLLNRVDSPDLDLEWTLNPYRGCEHGCIYCYARPGHEYLAMSCGVDFETRIVAKPDAPGLLRRELLSPGWKGEHIMLSGVTDPWQPVERKLEITRRCLEVFVELRHPVSVITKSRLILRDLDLLAELARTRHVHAAVSLTTLDNRLASIMEPRAAAPAHRLEVVSRLAAAGIPVTVMTAPIIPAINDHEIPALLEAARDAGARRAGYVLLRLPHQIKDLFLEWLSRHFPDRAAKVESFIRQSHEGKLYDARPFHRRRGSGPIAEHVRTTFKLFQRRCGLDGSVPPLARWTPPLFAAPAKGSPQLRLF